jgi:hypothetical protein
MTEKKIKPENKASPENDELGKSVPFDTFAQIIEGKAEIVIDKVSSLLQSGQGIIIPAHASNFIKANGRFKMIQTIIKSGYE